MSESCLLTTINIDIQNGTARIASPTGNEKGPGFHRGLKLVGQFFQLGGPFFTKSEVGVATSQPFFTGCPEP
jgi:hypothetical protein